MEIRVQIDTVFEIMFLLVDYKFNRCFFVTHQYSLICTLSLMGFIKVIIDQERLSQNPSSEKTQRDSFLSSCLYDGERSLGLSGIIWVFNIILKHFSIYFVFL